MSEYGLPILLQLTGVGVIVAEIILPSGGLLSIMAASLFGYSIYHLFTAVSTQAGVVFVGIDLVFIPLLVIVGLKLLAKSPVTLRTELSQADGVTSQAPGLADLLRHEGRSVTALRPSGVALIDGQRTDVVTRGEYVEKDQPLVVIAVSGNRIVVRQQD
jgi:membrane-bound ClpP family serine protease